MPKENVERVKEGFAAHNRSDIDAMVELYAPDAVFETLLLGTHRVAREQAFRDRGRPWRPPAWTPTRPGR